MDGDEPVSNFLWWFLMFGTKSKHSTFIFQVLLNTFSWINFSSGADYQHMSLASHSANSLLLFMTADSELRQETEQRGMACQTCVGAKCNCCQQHCQHSTGQLSHTDTQMYDFLKTHSGRVLSSINCVLVAAQVASCSVQPRLVSGQPVSCLIRVSNSCSTWAKLPMNSSLQIQVDGRFK